MTEWGTTPAERLSAYAQRWERIATERGVRMDEIQARAEAAEAALAETRRALEYVRGTLLGYWTDIPEAEIQRLLALIGSVNDQESAQA